MGRKATSSLTLHDWRMWLTQKGQTVPVASTIPEDQGQGCKLRGQGETPSSNPKADRKGPPNLCGLSLPPPSTPPPPPCNQHGPQVRVRPSSHNPLHGLPPGDKPRVPMAAGKHSLGAREHKRSSRGWGQPHSERQQTREAEREEINQRASWMMTG